MIKLNVNIKRQPDYTTCGPTSLHAVYSYYKDSIELKQVISEISQFENGGGTLATVLGQHALKRGFDATLYSYNINVFDPTWFDKDENYIQKQLQRCIDEGSHSEKHDYVLRQYIEFIQFGGKLCYEDLSIDLFKRILSERTPILTGLSSTWLYREAREDPDSNVIDPIHGSPVGHFVVVDGYTNNNEFNICDPYHSNAFNQSNHYQIDGMRLINSILLGISSYDGNFLLIKKRENV